jgi:hypothetical protein
LHHANPIPLCELHLPICIFSSPIFVSCSAVKREIFFFHLIFASLSCPIKVYVKFCILFIVGISFRVAPPFIFGQIKLGRLLKINKEDICRNTAMRIGIALLFL